MKKFGLLVFLLLAGFGGNAFSATIPEWAWKDESYMNRKRTNTTYAFKVFKTEDSSLTRLHEGRFYPLLKYLGEKYGADPETMAVDSLSQGAYMPYTYRITFPENGRTATVKARRVDVFSMVDHNVNLDPVFEYYQLYAVSEKDADVVFDDFQVGERSKGVAALLNVVAPGAGELYKGQTFKGWALLGSEVALGAAAITFHVRSTYYKAREEKGDLEPDSFRSEKIGMRRLRNITLGAMAGIWAFGLFDAFASESMPNITVSAPQGGNLTLAPAASSAGLSLVYRF